MGKVLDVEGLRREVMDDAMGVAMGPFPAAGGMMVEAEFASPDKLIAMARSMGINVEKYMSEEEEK